MRMSSTTSAPRDQHLPSPKSRLSFTSKESKDDWWDGVSRWTLSAEHSTGPRSWRTKLPRLSTLDSAKGPSRDPQGLGRYRWSLWFFQDASGAQFDCLCSSLNPLYHLQAPMKRENYSLNARVSFPLFFSSSLFSSPPFYIFSLLLLVWHKVLLWSSY